MYIPSNGFSIYYTYDKSVDRLLIMTRYLNFQTHYHQLIILNTSYNRYQKNYMFEF